MVYNDFRMDFRRLGLLLFLVGCTSLSPVPETVDPVPEAWKTVPSATRMDDICRHVSCPPRDPSVVVVADGKLTAAGKVLTPQFRAIDSFDVSMERREIVFSARRGDNFDAALVSLDGSDIHWLPEDRLDEIAVQWAPRGNKVSYTVRTPTGDLIRTVHIPTAMQLAADFAYARVRALAWDAAAERYSVVLTSPDASERVVSLKYDGTSRKTVVEPQVKLGGSIEPVRGGIMLRPDLLKYADRLPLVVWITDTPLEWNDARGALMRDNRVAMALLTKEPDDAFWQQMSEMPWIDLDRAFVVGPPPPAADRRGRRSYIAGDSSFVMRELQLGLRGREARDRHAIR